MNSKNKIKNFLLQRGQALNHEIAEYMRFQPGALSWRTRVSDIRKELQAQGGDLTCKELRKGIYLYKIIRPQIKVEPGGQLKFS